MACRHLDQGGSLGESGPLSESGPVSEGGPLIERVGPHHNHTGSILVTGGWGEPLDEGGLLSGVGAIPQSYWQHSSYGWLG